MKNLIGYARLGDIFSKISVQAIISIREIYLEFFKVHLQ